MPCWKAAAAPSWIPRGRGTINLNSGQYSPLETVVKRAMYRLGVLIGQPPTALERAVEALPLPTLPTLVALAGPKTCCADAPTSA